MLNARELSRLLTENSDDRLCKRWALATPNGTLLANSDTADARELKKHIAVVTLAWKDNDSSADTADASEALENGVNTTSPTQSKSPLRTLTIESESGNLIACLLQPNLLLVLEGGVPPRRRGFEPRVTAERGDDASYPDVDEDNQVSRPGTPYSSAGESTISKAATRVLSYQRQKLDAMADAIRYELQASGFSMPDDASSKMF